MSLSRQQVETSLDPQAERLINALSALPKSNFENIKEFRENYAVSRRNLLWQHLDPCTVEHMNPGDRTPGLTMFRPISQLARDQTRTFLFLHGGGWTVGSLEIYGPLCRRLCNVLKANIIFANYRLAPEHPFPAPLMDAERATRWVFANAFRLGISPARISIMGDSSGANLAAVLAIRNRDGIFGGHFQAQVLIYPCLDLTCQMPSHKVFGDGYLLTRKLYAWYVSNYLQGHDAKDWHVSPFLARQLTGIAPAVVLHAGFDPLSDEARAYVQRLRDEKVPVKELSFPDMMHGFINMGAVLEQADHAVLCIRASLNTLLAPRLQAH
jgi:acetyl esterase